MSGPFDDTIKKKGYYFYLFTDSNIFSLDIGMIMGFENEMQLNLKFPYCYAKVESLNKSICFLASF